MRNRDKYSQRYNVGIGVTAAVLTLFPMPGVSEYLGPYAMPLLIVSTVLNAAFVAKKQNVEN